MRWVDTPTSAKWLAALTESVILNVPNDSESDGRAGRSRLSRFAGNQIVIDLER